MGGRGPGTGRSGAFSSVILLLIPVAYQLFAIVACLWRRRSQKPGARSQKVSILKPVSGAGGNLRAALASHAGLDAELLCGVRSLDDPAVAIIREFPGVRLIECSTVTANAKVGVLIDLVRAASHETIIINDSDICVPPDYLARVIGPLADPEVGLVTCLYRAVGDTFAARFEALGVATDFAPSTLVARLVGVDEFALGSTLAFRRADLERIGGFEAIGDYLADDYQLGHRIHALGLKCVLSDVIVETHLGGSWRDVWQHQVRWARTIRVSKFYGYLGLPVTFATFWAAVCGNWRIGLAILGVRMLMAIEAGWFKMRSPDVLNLFWAIPLRDLFGVAVWLAGLFGNTVIWRGRKLRLDGDGRIRQFEDV
jgi:ceramide glucosyltransferase